MDKVTMETNGANVSPQQAETIRQLYKEGGITQAKLGEQFGVSGQAIGQIIRGITHRSTLRDEDNWPVNDQSEQMRVLRIKNTLLEKRVHLLELQMWHLKNNLGVPNEFNKPEPFNPIAPRWINGVDTYSDDYIKLAQSAEGLQTEIDIANGSLPVDE